MQIANRMCRNFSDDGYDNVPQNGGGSSFDGRWFDGAGYKMKTDQRYQQFESDAEFQNMLRNYSRAIEMSDKWLMRMD